MTRRVLVEANLTGVIIGAFFGVFNNLGFGFLEYVYNLALERDLITLGHKVGREVGVIVMYKGEELTEQRIDMLVDGRVIVEVKATAQLATGAQRQLYNYLRATRLQVGLLLHFGLEPKFYRVFNEHSVRVDEMSASDEATLTKVNSDSADPADASDLLRKTSRSVPNEPERT